MPRTTLHLAATPGASLPTTPATGQVLYQELRRNTALAAGIEAIATLAIDQGEASADQLEHLASLSVMLRQDLEQLAGAMVELAGQRGRDE